MPTEGSVTGWIGKIQTGDSAAAQALWERYFQQLVHLARNRLRGAPRRAADEEDVALSAFDSFCRAAEKHRIPQVTDRDSLWRLLVTITVRKARRLIRDECRVKRGGGHVLDENALADDEAGLDEVIGTEPTPDFAAQVAEEYRLLLDRLDNEELQAIAQWKLEGYSDAEIAEKLDCVSRTIERKLAMIRKIWDPETPI
jgi:DNA-directed RNA polymerase specialized sigma24 family protein